MSIVVERPLDPYDGDFFSWTQRQARLLKSIHSLKGALPEGLDLAAIAEEIEDLGKSELHAAESQIQNVFLHLIKAASDPGALAFSHWRVETTRFQIELMAKYVPSMRQHIDLQHLWRAAMRLADATLRQWGRARHPNMPVACPFTIEMLISEEFDFDQAVERLVSIAAS